MTTTQGKGRSATVPAAPAGRSREGMPSGTPDQVALFDAIVAKQVRGYPGWSRPQAFWKPNMLDERDETSRANRFLAAGLVVWESAWCDGADRSAKYRLQPTEAGLAWRQRCADREARRAARGAS